MLSKKIIILFGFFVFIAGCLCNTEPKIEPVVVSPNLLAAITTIDQSQSAKDLISDKLDQHIIQEIENQTSTDSSRYILKIPIQDKYLYTFPIKRSARLNYHINRLNNAEEVYNGLEGQFNKYFYESRFNTQLGIAKFYFEQSLPDTTLQRFLDMCVLDEYEIIEIE